MTELEVASDRSALTAGVEVGRHLRVPVNHFEGNYTASPEVLHALEEEGRVVLRDGKTICTLDAHKGEVSEGVLIKHMVGRELRMIELKKEINQLCAEMKRPPQYPKWGDEKAP